ncbi:coiled-coil domain-containing protein 57 isoform X4 [Haemorhous mexicanus]|uniref:coiled-coil domain-containing protein 57 isoform X4 n=1 Tax=Haemorhous mexicanus TaxID=30427 RepID=UPI0028BF312C|nr:coiled-coil domain-containing protein 57 isoform X4 [Haemorhous mexicanus]
MQAELNWQRLCENAECNCYQKSEDPTHSLSSSTAEVQADLQKTDYRLHEVKCVLSALTVEREQTIQASFNHSISPEGEKQIFQYDNIGPLCKYIPALEIKKLQEQNASLRAAIAQMRKEMESLDEQMLSSLPQTDDRQLAEQGSLSTNKNSAGTTLSNIKVSSTKLDCLVNPDTEEELQCTRQQHPSRFSSLTACPSLKEEEAPSSCREETELSSSEVWIDFSIENHGPHTFSATKADTSRKTVQTQLLSQSPSHVQQVQLSSSRTHNFCQILDTGSSRSLLSPRKNTSQGDFEVVHSIKQSEESWQNVKAKDKLETSAEDLTVRGKRLEVQQKLKSRSLFCAHLLKPKISSSMTKIRNYNIKD